MVTEEITISELELADEVLADMTLPVDTVTETRAVTLKQLRAWLGSSLPTGFIIPAVGKISDERFTLLDGKTLSRAGTYEAFCNKVVSEVQAGNWFACSEDEYAQDLSDFGQCGKFVVSNDYIRIPTITRFIGATITLSEIGKTYKESLPNITGQIATGYNSYSGASGTVSGAFKKVARWTNGCGEGGQVSFGGADFDASLSSSAYQDNAKVQPDHTKYPYYMVVSTEGQTAEIGIDINQVYEDLNLKANSDLSNVASVAKSFKEKSIVWDIPDFENEIAVANVKGGFVYTTPSIGYLKINRSASDGSVTAYLYKGIDSTGIPIYNRALGSIRALMNNASQFNTGFGFTLIKVDKNENYFFNSNNISRCTLSFVPCKGV